MVTSIWRKTAVVGMVVAMMAMAIPLATLNAAADDEEQYWFYVDLTPDFVLNGEWISGTGTNPPEAFINALNARYGAENNSIDPSGWIIKINGLTTEGTWQRTWRYIDWAQFGCVDGVFDYDAHMMGGAKPTTENQYAIFRYVVVWAEIIVYEGASTLTEQQVLQSAVYDEDHGAIWPLAMGPVPDDYTPKAISATYSAADGGWNVVWYILPNAQLNHVDEYAKLTVPAYGYAQRDEAAGLQPYTPATEPGAPTNLAAAAGNGQAILRWVAPSSNGGAAITHYVVYQDDVSIGTYTGTTATVTGLTNGVSYTFAVAAVNSVGESSKSNEAVATPSENAEVFTPGTEFTMFASSDASGRLNVTYDPAALRFVSAVGATSIVTAEGAVNIRTAGENGPVEVNFAVVEDPVLGDTTVTLNGESKAFNIVPGEPVSYSSFVIVEQDETRNVADVSLYKVPQIAGFKLVFHYTSGTPVVNVLGGLGARGSFSTAIDPVGKTLTIVWANSENVDLNDELLFTISGANGVTLTPTDAELRHITDDINVSVRVSVGVASSYEDAVDQDPNPGTDLNGDGQTDLADLILLMQYLAGYDVSIDLENADYTGDGVVDIRDAVTLQDLITVA